MKSILAVSLLLSITAYAQEIDLNKAPTEWLVSQTFVEGQEISHSDSPIQNTITESVLEEVLSMVDYSVDTDELKMKPSFTESELREKLISFLGEKVSRLVNENDPEYKSWAQEGHSQNPVTLNNVSDRVNGYYFFNHIHTSVSQDNKEMKKLKFTPRQTVNLIKKFIGKRSQRAVAVFSDHSDHSAYEQAMDMMDNTFGLYRAIEWGADTHMNLIDMKANWDLIDRGSSFKGEESIISSRTSDAFRVLNHPYQDEPMPYTNWSDVNGIEVWNSIMETGPFKWVGKLKPVHNKETFDEWKNAAKNDRKYTAVAGSDFHFAIPCLRDRTMFYPANFIPSANLDAFRLEVTQGNVSFVTKPTAPKLNLLARSNPSSSFQGMGSSLNANGEIEVILELDFSDTEKKMDSICYNVVNSFYNTLTSFKKKVWEVRFYNKEGVVIAKASFDPDNFGTSKSLNAKFNYQVQDKDLIRAELWEVNHKMKSIDLLGGTNPIYINL